MINVKHSVAVLEAEQNVRTGFMQLMLAADACEKEKGIQCHHCDLYEKCVLKTSTKMFLECIEKLRELSMLSTEEENGTSEKAQ